MGKKYRARLGSIVLAVSMIFAFLPMEAGSAFAAQKNGTVQAGGTAIQEDVQDKSVGTTGESSNSDLKSEQNSDQSESLVQDQIQDNQAQSKDLDPNAGNEEGSDPIEEYKVIIVNGQGFQISSDHATAAAGTQVRLSLKLSPGYELKRLLLNGKAITGMTFTMEEKDATVTAEAVKKKFQIRAQVSSKKAGKVTGARTVTYGSSITLTAVPKKGYYLVKWTEKGKTISKSKKLTVKNIDRAHTYKAVFAKIKIQNQMDKAASKQSSSTKYLIMVNKKTHRVGIYKGKKGNWTRKYYWKCTTGKKGTPTPSGNYKIGKRGHSFGHGYTCYYWTGFIGTTYLFHSVIYAPGSRHITDGRLGISASHGCIRLAIGNAKWINRNIPSGTRVHIY